jgi:hypothetical protein
MSSKISKDVIVPERANKIPFLIIFFLELGCCGVDRIFFVRYTISIMDRNILLKDCAIIFSVLFVGGLLYFAFPSRIAPVPDGTQEGLSNNKEIMDAQQTTQLKIDVLKEGTGDGAQNGQMIAVHSTGMLTDGKEFDSSIPRGEPLTLTLGAGQVIPGWDLGLLGMKMGEKRRLTIAPELAYGKDGFPGVIPPNATLIFEVELVAIK